MSENAQETLESIQKEVEDIEAAKDKANDNATRSKIESDSKVEPAEGTEEEMGRTTRRSKRSLDSNAKPEDANAKSGGKRSSRLRDPEFAAKHKAFLVKVGVATNGSMDTYLKQETTTKMDSKTAVATATGTATSEGGVKRKLASPVDKPAQSPDVKRRRSARNSSAGTADAQNDCYCWICHKEGQVICCETCPRVFHLKCIQLEDAPTEDWVCPECVLIMTAENMDTRSRAMRLLSVDQLCTLLKHALTRMRTVSGSSPFTRPVDPIEFPAYRDYVTCPMDLLSIEKNVRKKQYGSTEAFLADVKWVLHNCIIFNTTGSKLTSIAKQLVKVCKHEMQEIENCPDCYTNAHTKKESWFIAACRIPHLLVWAKLKGFPFWPGKAMRVNSEDNVDVRFFGAHDRAWIPIKDVYLYSNEPPVAMKNKRKGNLEVCVNEVELYIKKIKEKFSAFQHAPFKTQLDPKKEEEQIKMLYPKCNLPFELGPTLTRARALSFSGSERSHMGTPTPSETDLSEPQTVLEKTEGAKDSLLANQSMETEEEEDSKLELEEDEAAEEEEEEEEVDDVEPVEEEEDKSSKTIAVEGKELASNETNPDRVAASPPCEVSSTTQLTDIANKKTPSSTPAVQQPPKGPKEAVIAETSERILIEGDDDEEEEIDDVEEEPEGVVEPEEIDDVEPDENQTSEKPIEEKEEEKERENDSPVEESEESSPPKEAEKEAETKETSKEEESPKATEVSEKKDEEDEEIDDVEPEVEKAVEVTEEEEEEEEINDVEEEEEQRLVIDEKEKQAEDKTEEGSVADKDQTTEESTEISKKRKTPDESVETPSSKKSNVREEEEEEEEEEEPRESIQKSAPEISLGSDISVTVVQKKKTNQQPQLPVPRISVKKESELLADSGHKDIVHVSKAKKAAPRKSADEDDRNPPDPIVTISKVQSLVSSLNPVPKKDAAPKETTPAQQPRKSIAPTATSGLPPAPNVAGPRPSNAPAPRMSSGFPRPRHNSMMRMPGGGGGGPMGMPSLHPRPQGPLSAPPPLPPAAGPVSEQLNRVAGKLVDYMRISLEELFREMAGAGSPEATIKALQIEMEKIQWRHQQELAETRHNAELKFQELQHAMEADKQKVLSDLKKQMELEKQKAVTEAKKKQWCANCGKEAIFYCCWNTSYCDYPCQQAHWPSHMSTCAQNQSNNDEEGNNAPASSSEHRSSSHPHPSAHPPSQSGMDHSDHNAGSHFLSNPSAVPNRSQSNNMMGPSRNMQPMMMPFGPGGINPRLMSQMGLRFCPPPHGGPSHGGPPHGGPPHGGPPHGGPPHGGPHHGGPPPRGVMPPHMRFPGNYFM